MSSVARKKPKAGEEVGGEAMLSVPEEIYLEIPLRVPVKSMYVCKCVCKSWFQIISNPSFVKTHLNIATQKENYNLVFNSHDTSGEQDNWTINSISYDSLLSVNACESEILELVDYPFNSVLDGDVRLLGSCNGLVCFWYVNGVETKFFYICNPATKEYKIIPKPKSRHGYLDDYDNTYMINAFGYDCKTDDYKFINVVEYVGTDQLLAFDVYMLGSNSWESSHTVTYKFPDKRQTAILVNGAFHWLGEAREKKSPKLIISMNISNEKFNELQLPKQLSKKKTWSMTIGVLEGCLCLVGRTDVVCYQVWMMKDYGVQESWSQIHIIYHESIRVYTIDYESIPFAHNVLCSLRLVQSFKDGQILLKHGSWLVIYDSKHSRGRQPKFFSSLRLQNATTYVESLVSLNSGTYAGRNKEHDEEQLGYISLKLQQ